MAQSQDGRDTVQVWVHKPKENKPRKRKEKEKVGLSTIRVRVTRNRKGRYCHEHREDERHPLR